MSHTPSQPAASPPNPPATKAIRWQQRGPLVAAQFSAMACPCELLFAGEAPQDTRAALATIVTEEVWRIEAKYNRFSQTGLMYRINNAAGEPTEIDDETRGLLEYARELYTLSDGLFDITSGTLKVIWAFHQKGRTPSLPSPAQIADKLALIGFENLALRDNTLTLPAGMQLDLGGIGKEYAADRALQLITPHLQSASLGALINLGGDIVASEQPSRTPWHIGIRSHDASQQVLPHSAESNTGETLTLTHGAVTTSGTSERRWVIDGKTYSHILNPKTGWPVEDPPLAVTVAAPTCMQAGMLSTLIMLQGKKAEAFVAREQIDCWLHR